MTLHEALNLRSHITEVLRATDLADPGDVADEVDRRISDSELRTMLREALRVFVRQVMSEQRERTTINTVNPGGPSVKVAGIRDYWQRSLRDRVHTGTDTWKLLGDCTAADLHFAAEERRIQAERNIAKERQYRTLGLLVQERGVERVRDLPADVLMTTLGRAA